MYTLIIVSIFIFFVITTIVLYQTNEDLRQKIKDLETLKEIEKNSLIDWVHIEVQRRRIYTTLYENLKHNNLKLSTKYSNAINYIKRKL
jgi:predicted PurR-regulated permease PerM